MSNRAIDNIPTSGDAAAGDLCVAVSTLTKSDGGRESVIHLTIAQQDDEPDQVRHAFLPFDTARAMANSILAAIERHEDVAGHA